ncbi:hypothetical protein PF005_g6355 [Phytophthora fragariae]|uniref:Uncharacterized protein n=1 Tax=Phytophthora fragariae TaxID=53985 RepID=A0A6A3LY13_9STRA|nr:hypothetical protein PF003_g27841 [Phytophthora fragariae]KAE8945571.1 hypothetical protein PF009_g4759 [Phytophthora fragariae]KAE9024701.1 hypothetical protein PF011_g3377 [Phytophthora fragariae]KAE9123750.1 hypothetical protein PF010_g6266 [Phytophthora fragariae]KAE9134459.1 hypothetical protein PF007_g2918 [Phytophthora fragariae]
MALIENYKLLKPLQMSDYHLLKNNVVFGPATPARINPRSHAPSEMTATYYEQRSRAGLIIRKPAPSLSKASDGTDHRISTPPRRRQEVVDCVHKKGGKICAALAHGSAVAPFIRCK